MTVSKLFVATKAFITYNGKILLLREANTYVDGAHTGHYLEPGGRVEPGQHFEESLHREIEEETGLKVTIGKPFYVGEWRPVVRGEQWQIVGIFFECFTESNQVTLSPDHDDAIWINPKDYKNYDLIDPLPQAFEAYITRDTHG